jgi:hypothetical protein
MNRIVGVSFALAVVLSACGRCPPYIPRVVGCPVPATAPLAMKFQKRGQIGHTDYNQRKEDMIECGIPRERFDVSLGYIWHRAPDETSEQQLARQDKFVQCIKAKDYLWLGLKECGPVQENWGVCK